MNTSSVTLKDWLIFLFLCVIWGSSFILIKKGLIAFSPVEVAILRICIASVAFVPIYFFVIRQHISRTQLKYIIFAGFLGNGFPAFLYAMAQTHVASSVAGILNSLTPIFTWILGMLFFATAFRLDQFVGVFIGFVGAAIIILLNTQFHFSLDTFSLLIVVGTICYGLSANIVKTHLQDINPIVLSAIALFSVGIPALIVSPFTGLYHDVFHTPGALVSLSAIAVLALMGTVFANILFFRLIQNTNAVFGSSVAYLIPLTALGWGLIDGEVLGLIHVLGMGLILTGIYLLRKS